MPCTVPGLIVGIAPAVSRSSCRLQIRALPETVTPDRNYVHLALVMLSSKENDQTNTNDKDEYEAGNYNADDFKTEAG